MAMHCNSEKEQHRISLVQHKKNQLMQMFAASAVWRTIAPFRSIRPVGGKSHSLVSIAFNRLMHLQYDIFCFARNFRVIFTPYNSHCCQYGYLHVS
jgi:hypothetical protein